MASALSNHYKHQLHSGLIDFDGDTFKVALMATGYTFDKDADATWADVSASELTNGNGYVTNGQTLGGVAVSEDDTNDRSDVTWTNPSWTASGGSIGPSPGAIIYDDTHASDCVVGYIDFGADQTATDGGTFTISNPTVRLT